MLALIHLAACSVLPPQLTPPLVPPPLAPPLLLQPPSSPPSPPHSPAPPSLPPSSPSPTPPPALPPESPAESAGDESASGSGEETSFACVTWSCGSGSGESSSGGGGGGRDGGGGGGSGGGRGGSGGDDTGDGGTAWVHSPIFAIVAVLGVIGVLVAALGIAFACRRIDRMRAARTPDGTRYAAKLDAKVRSESERGDTEREFERAKSARSLESVHGLERAIRRSAGSESCAALSNCSAEDLLDALGEVNAGGALSVSFASPAGTATSADSGHDPGRRRGSSSLLARVAGAKPIITTKPTQARRPSAAERVRDPSQRTVHV